jgi:DNA helicase-2/ATP-dependent DNA helicase PcrA
MPILDVLRNALTPAQFDAATDPSDEVLCLACAGSGKSRTLAYRIAWLLARDAEPADPHSIVAFTFTEKAADTIKRRVAGALEAAGLDATALGAMYIGTIHAFCQKVLTEIDARFRQFDVLDDNRLQLFLISRFFELGLQNVRAARHERYFPTVAEVAKAWKTINDEMLEIGPVTEQDPVIGAVLEALRRRLGDDEFIDFSLMIRLVVAAFQNGDVAGSETVNKLAHLMVDEYQDVNPAQEALIQGLHGRSRTLFVVGDDDQAVYSWRGADVSNIRSFRRRFAGSSEHTLSHNFRSTRAIVAAADGFVSAELGATRITKNPTADNHAGPRDFRKLWFATRAAEAEWVAARIRALLGTAYSEQDGTVRGLTPGDFAILMRSTRGKEQDDLPRHAAFTQALSALGVEYSLEAGGGAFDRPQVRVLCDTFELLRAGSPSRETALEHFNRAIAATFPHADFDQFAVVLAEWGRKIHGPIEGARRRVYPQQMVHDLLQAFGIQRTDFEATVMRDLGLFSRIIQDVEAVYLSIDSRGRFAEILNFLGNVAETGYDTSTDDILRRPDAVSVTTVHKAKGLEFPVVFVVDVEARRFPMDQSGYEGWLPAPVMQNALARGAYQTTHESEVRLFYTAVTRAERYLYVTGCDQLPNARRARRQSSFALRLVHPEISDDSVALPTGLVPHLPVPRIDETDMPTTFSDIRYFLLCPKTYQFRKSFGFSPPIPEMFGFGQTVHTVVGRLHQRFTDRAPSADEAEELARGVFHLKHVAPSRDPENRPGPYERARARAGEIARTYAENFGGDFAHERQVEARFEVPIRGAVISGSIDLLLKEDEAGNILEASVIDFKAIEGGDEPEMNEAIDWTALALQVQLYAKAAREVLGENARTGAVHLLKDNQRVEVPVSDEAVAAAVGNVEWAVRSVIDGDFPRRPHPAKCPNCDFKALCGKAPEDFRVAEPPPPIHVPGEGGVKMARAFSEYEH